MTEDCAGPIGMLHTHGFADKVVPFKGRTIESSEYGLLFIQGHIWEGLQLWRRENSCPSNPAEHRMSNDFWRKRWDCNDGSLEIVPHKGSQSRPNGWTRMTLDWFESLDR